MSFRFRKTKPSRIFQDVVEQIQNAIISEDLKPGDVLPSEMKMKDMFETSRGTIREALRVLEQKGFIQIKTGVGGGAIVKRVGAEKIAESLNLWVQCQKASLDDLAEFREHVEGSVAALAAERATEKDVQYLKQLLDEVRSLQGKESTDWDDFDKIDVQIHMAIAEIARNPLFKVILRMVHEEILKFFEPLSLKEQKVPKEHYDDFYDLVRAIANHEGKEASSLAQLHVRKFKRYYLKKSDSHNEGPRESSTLGRPSTGSEIDRQ
jgi:GntR family transcriptional regulator, transcriptional repressor for pyruvate dehydrogenase complex